MILILADSTDPWATLVHREAHRTGGDAVWIDPLQLLDKILLNWPVVAGEAVVPGFLNIDGQTIPLDDLTGIFARCPFPLRLDLADLTEADAEYVKKEATAAWIALLNALPCAVVNKPVPGGRPTLLSGSPRLARLAAEHGFSLPSVRCTSSLADALRHFEDMGQSAYLKPLGSGEPGRFLYQQDGADHLREVMERQAVSLQTIPQGQQATVYVAGKNVAATVLRPGAAVPASMEVQSAHAAQCLGLVQALDLTFAECQIVITPEGRTYCLDVSSAPDFWRCPQEVQQQMVEQVLEHLSEMRSLSLHDSPNGSDGRSSARECVRPTRSPER